MSEPKVCKNKQRVIGVLGMHRSGTSCLTGSLEEAGVFLGNVQRKNPHNQKGNCEHAGIMQLHQDLFDTNGGRWDRPPLQMIWSDKHRKIRDEIIKEYECTPLWGFKDPRTLFSIEGWMEVIPGITLIGSFRHPLASARSLKRRNNFTMEKGLQIWKAYNTKLLEHFEQEAFPIISFDVDEHTYKKNLCELLSTLGLSLAQHEFNFFENGLRSETVESDLLSEEIQDIYDRLQKAKM